MIEDSDFDVFSTPQNSCCPLRIGLKPPFPHIASSRGAGLDFPAITGLTAEALCLGCGAEEEGWGDAFVKGSL